MVLAGCTTTPQATPSPQVPSTTPTHPSSAAIPGKSYDLKEVALHASEKDCWMAIEGKVYDVTSYVSRHPGGKAILNGCGKDATVLFNERPTNQKGPHPAQAKQQLAPMQIGILAQ